MKCKQCNRREAARNDDYCSAWCAKLAYGTLTQAEAKAIKAEMKTKWVEVENPFVSRAMHTGPHAAKDVRPKSRRHRS
jgi:hypothetical protein